MIHGKGMRMRVTVMFWSYYRDIAGGASIEVELAEGATLGDAVNEVCLRFPRLAGFRASTLMAVGVEYQAPDHVLSAGDEISLFPPVQGG
jgi:molybdopterin converting factor small subunit